MNKVWLSTMAQKQVATSTQWISWCTARILCFNKF